MNFQDRSYDDWRAKGPHEDLPSGGTVKGPRPASREEARRLDREAAERRAATLARLMAWGGK